MNVRVWPIELMVDSETEHFIMTQPLVETGYHSGNHEQLNMPPCHAALKILFRRPGGHPQIPTPYQLSHGFNGLRLTGKASGPDYFHLPWTGCFKFTKIKNKNHDSYHLPR